MTQTIRKTLALSALCLATACGGGAADEDEAITDDTTTGGETESTEVAGDVAWADMGPEERGAFMQNTVMPEMQALFQEHDAERFADFGCATCHGDDAQEVGFQMPNGVAPLDPSQVGAMFQSEEPMAQLMVQRVWPRMAELLNEPQFNPETGEGFSCFNCHATAEGG